MREIWKKVEEANMNDEMVDVFVLLGSITFILVNLVQVLWKEMSMALDSSPPPPLTWQNHASFMATIAKKRDRQAIDLHSSDSGSLGFPSEVGLIASVSKEVGGKVRKRPARIVIPENRGDFSHEEGGELVNEVEVETSEYCLASRRGRSRRAMEDRFEVMTNIDGNTKMAFFGVFDGHGGRYAVDFVKEKLGKNILATLAGLEGKDEQIDVAVKAGYLTTDKEFSSQGVTSGACVATALFKDGYLHVANVGDCRVVLSKVGEAIALTNDHRAERDDERARIESSGGYVSFRNGVWRVDDSLAVSRAIGDVNMKEWIISEPESMKLKISEEFEFIIMASDGLWDKVTNQEAVDVVSRSKNSTIQSCKELVEMACSRGSRDDITVMVVDLHRFV